MAEKMELGRIWRASWTGRLLAVCVALAVAGAACSSGGSEGVGDGDEGDEPSQEPLTSESITSDDAGGEMADDDGVFGPTLDGSASPGDVTDVWTMVLDDDFAPDAARSLFEDMEGGTDGGLVIAGTTTDHEKRSFHATVWHSDDAGASLNRVILPTLLEGVKSGVSDVELVPLDSSPAVDHGITEVVAGSVGSGPGQRAAIWIRSDGEWSQLDSDAFLAERREWTHRLSVGPDGELLVLGSTTDAGGDVSPVAWRSSDGRTWTRLTEAFDELPDTTLSDAAISDDGMVVIGQYIDGTVDNSQVYVSTDGETWDQSVPPSFVGDNDVLVRSVIAGPDGGYVAVGSVTDGDGVHSPASWTSADGVEWIGPSTNFGLNDDGRSASNGLGAERVRSSTDGFLAIATNSFLQHVWQSDDGATWNPVGNIWDVEPDGVDLLGVTATDEVTIVAGEGQVYSGSAGSWSELPAADDVVPQPSTIPWSNAAASTGEGFVVVGGVEDSRGELLARAWTSPDGREWAVTENGAMTTAALTTGPYLDVAATEAGYLLVAPETTTISSRIDRYGLSYLHMLGPEGMGLPTLHLDRNARVMLSSVATLDDEVVMAGVTFDGTTVKPIMVGGVLSDTAFEPIGPSTLNGAEPMALEPVSVPLPGRTDREAWGPLCSSADTMVAVLNLDDTSSTSIGFYSRTAGAGWAPAEAGADVVAAEDSNWVNACAHGPTGFLAVGGVRSGSDSDGSMWHSVDGSEWDRVDGPAGLDDPTSNAWISDVVVHGDEYLMIGRAEVEGAAEGKLWIGSPAAGWTEVPAANNPVDFDVRAIAVDDAGTVVVTGWQDGQMTVVSATFDQLLTVDS